MKNEILDFIHRRWTKDANWLNGNCYWFAHILCTRFSQLEIYYEPIIGHFIAGDGNEYFDWSGEYKVNKNTVIYKLSDIKEFDDLWYNHLMRDCKN